jgi:hypothetical protein
MSIWDGIKSAGGAIVGSLQEKQRKINELKERYAYLSDEQLIRKYKNSTGDVKVACLYLIRERGIADQYR